MSVPSTFAIERFLADTLGADPVLAGKVHNGVIPAGTPFPACVFEPVNNLATSVVGGVNILDVALYWVKVVGEGRGMGQLRAMAVAVRTRLHQASGTNVDGHVWFCQQDEEQNAPPDVVSGVIYRTLGQRFRIEAKGADA